VELGDSDETVGMFGDPMVNVADACPPPGAALVTATAAVPALSRSVDETEMVNSLELTNEAVREELFQVTADPEMKPDPFTVSVNPPLPAAADAGDRD